MADLLDKHIAAILRLLDEADDIISALYRQGVNKDYKCKSLREKLRAIENELTKVDSVPKWIPCSERLPEIFEDVLIVYLGFEGEKHITKAYMDDEENAFDWCSSWNGDVIDAEVTHWMPVSLLAPPDEK